jgi:putative beta-lysine N-acetyltransferase
MCDILETIHGSAVQHGKHNDRVYVMHLDSAAEGALLGELEKLVWRHGYRKVFAKIPATSWRLFQSAGFTKEAEIPLLFSGKRDCYFVARFFGGRQHTGEDFSRLREILAAADFRHARETDRSDLTPVQQCCLTDTEALALFYREVFVSYPFPIFEPSYLEKIMQEDVVYYCVRNHGTIIAAAAADLTRGSRYAEMTDFATATDWRKQGLAASLLNRMEGDLEKYGILTAFTIARAGSQGMNMVLKRGGYRYAGLLVNNTQISGRIESMTVWYKRLQERGDRTVALSAQDHL